MKNILNFENYIFESYEYDGIAKSTFSKLLSNIEDLEVRKFSDNRREVTIKKNKDKDIKESIDPNYRIKRRELKNPEKKEIITKDKETTFKSMNSPDEDINVIVMKNHSKHRFSSKLFGVLNQDSYSLSINGKHFVSDVRGKEGKMLVDPSIAKIYWNFLTDLHNIQDKYKRGLIDSDSYDTSLSKIKSKYSSKI